MLLRCTQTFVALSDLTVVRVGTVVESDDPIVKGRSECFAPVVATFTSAGPVMTRPAPTGAKKAAAKKAAPKVDAD